LKILITGGSGLLGSKIAGKAVEKGYKVYSGYKTHEPMFGIPMEIEISDKIFVNKIFESLKPDIVIHTAALTDVDKCEEDNELAWRTNVEGTRNIAEISREYEAFLVYVSTDYVFSGEEGMYREMDETNPINYYGVTKLEGEKNVKTLMDEWCIARPSVIYGSTPATGKVNFALWVLEKLERREPMNIITDQYVSPTLNTNLAEMILEVLERRLTGVYHLAGATPMNRYDFACFLAETFRLDKKLIRQAKFEDMKWKAKRPRKTTLNVEKALQTLNKKPMKIDDALNVLKKEMVQAHQQSE
jgi:dTDP-4-dehydrorhamnose reductase